MRFIALALFAALVAAKHDGHALVKHGLPKAFENAKFSVFKEKETIVDRVRRFLGNWMGYDLGNGFVTVTGFTDDQCLHPIWETGANVGRCMMAKDSSGNTIGWMKNRLQQGRGGVFKFHADIWYNTGTNNGCQGASDDNMVHGEGKDNCQPYHTYIDGAGPVRSITYGFLAQDKTPKIVHFAQGMFRGKVVFDDNTMCTNHDWERMNGIGRYYLQRAAAMLSCYQAPAADGTMKSYRTWCSGLGDDDDHDDNNNNNSGNSTDDNNNNDGNNDDGGGGGPGFPINAWYDDDQCMQENGQYNMFDQCNDVHPPANAQPMAQMYGGARQYHSSLLGDAGVGESYSDICFFAGMGGGENDGPPLSFWLTPWNTYKDMHVFDYEDEGRERILLIYSDESCNNEIGEDVMDCDHLSIEVIGPHCDGLEYDSCYVFSYSGNSSECLVFLEDHLDHWKEEYGEQPKSIELSSHCE